MNDKIQSIKKQCYICLLDPDRNGDLEYDMEKFAELLIRECARVAAEVGDLRTGVEYVIPQLCSLEIKKHFGIYP